MAWHVLTIEARVRVPHKIRWAGGEPAMGNHAAIEDPGSLRVVIQGDLIPMRSMAAGEEPRNADAPNNEFFLMCKPAACRLVFLLRRYFGIRSRVAAEAV
jgi:hypothetical protein